MYSGCFSPVQLAELFSQPNYMREVRGEVVALRDAHEKCLNDRDEDPASDPLWCELDTEAALMRFGLEQGFNYPFLLGLPSTSQRRMVFEGFVPLPGVGFWLTPNLDTFTMVAASLMQFTNFAFSPAKVAK